jgi:hypothetical protein
LDELERAVDSGDLDDLVRWVDRLVDARDWDGLVRLRDLSRAALARGRQLWPAASLAEYRLALDAPAAWAAAVLVPGAGHFALGPLSEVAASTHTWAELAPHAPPTPVAAFAAHERVVRGEPVRQGVGSEGEAAAPGGPAVPIDVLELPTALAEWEPTYPVATYHPDRIEAPRPDLPPLHDAGPLPEVRGVERYDHDPAAEALAQLASTWRTASNGRVEAVAVAGGALDAIAALGAPSARTARIGVGEAMALMAWTAASGGAHGPRRGMAAGRFDAWWALAALCGLEDPWPPDPAELGSAAAELELHVWDAHEPDTGWALRLAVADPADQLAWALTATDHP